MGHPRLQKSIAFGQKYGLLLFTWTYVGALRHYTLDPIAAIEKHQHDRAVVLELLKGFRQRKEYELRFVQRAATLSAAAVIGVKSWPDTVKSFWLAQVAWNCSLFFSILSLVSSSQESLLENLPRGDDGGDPDTRLREALLVVLVTSRDEDVERTTRTQGPPLVSSPWLLLLWQTPLMLMHYSWLTFLVGYELYLITPLIELRGWTAQCTGAVIATIVGVLLIAHFQLNSVVTARTHKRSSREREERAKSKSAGEASGTENSTSGQPGKQ